METIPKKTMRPQHVDTTTTAYGPNKKWSRNVELEQPDNQLGLPEYQQAHESGMFQYILEKITTFRFFSLIWPDNFNAFAGILSQSCLFDLKTLFVFKYAVMITYTSSTSRNMTCQVGDTMPDSPSEETVPEDFGFGQ